MRTQSSKANLFVWVWMKVEENFPKGEGLQVLLFLFWICIAIIVTIPLIGHQAAKIMSTEKMGTNQIDEKMFTISSVITFLLGLFIIIYLPPFHIGDQYFGEIRNICCGIFFMGAGIWLYQIGMKELKNARDSKIDKNSPGITKWLGKHEDASKINLALHRNLYDPLAILITTPFIMMLHPIVGLAWVVCAISYWVVTLIEHIIDFGKNEGEGRFSENHDFSIVS